MALLERDAQLASLREYAQDAHDGAGRLVLLAGEAGVGKSVLLEQFQHELPGARWSWGACDGLSTPRPLAPLFDLATELGGHLSELCQGHRERDELFRALLQQVTDGEHRHVLVVEDIHWADEATLDLLRFLARRIRTASVVLIATYRDDWLEAAAPLRLALGELATLRWARRLELAPLSPGAVSALAADTDLDAHELFELTGGNPFYVTAMIEAETHGVPLSARDAVLARAARLSEPASQLLAYASLIGTRVEHSVLTAATRCSPQTLDELINSGLLVEEGDLLRFRHEIARLAVEQQVAAHRRRAMHADILTAMRSIGSADDARLAFHAEGAGDDAAVVRHSSRAARRASELGSHREATAQYQRALRSCPGADVETAAGLYSALAGEAALGDASQLAADADEHALALWRELGDHRQVGETLRRWSTALQQLCRGDEARAAVEQAIDVLEPLGPTTELAAAYATLAAMRMTRNEDTAAIELAQRAQAVARQVGATAVIADTLNTEGCARSATDPSWAELVRRALELALSHNLQQQAGRAYGNLYGVLCGQYRYAEAEQYLVDGIAYCEEHDLDTYAYFLRAVQTATLLNQGEWDAVLTLCVQLLEESTTAPMNQICLYTRIGIIHARRGQTGVWDALDRAIETAEPTGQPQYIVPARLARAEASWLEGRLLDARREAELAADAAGETGPWIRGALDAWLRRTGSNRPIDDDVSEPYRLHRLGRHVAAAQQWDGLGCRYDGAMTLLDASEESALRTALRSFDELGATAAARVTRQRLRQLGVRSIPVGPRAATRADPLGLTRRERQVLELLTRRQTNAEIAQTLFISAKTVDHHVSAVLAKLDVGSRELAAAAAIRLGLVAPLTVTTP